MRDWDEIYDGSPGWDIGYPQHALVKSVRNKDLVLERVLDVDCRKGDNAIFLAKNGFSVVGIDLVSKAIQSGIYKALELKVKVDFFW